MIESKKTKLSQLLETLTGADDGLPKADRADRYRRLAAEAFQLAEECADHTLRAGYISLASGWHSLAFEIERSSHFPGE